MKIRAQGNSLCRVLAVIPARYASTRFPGKALVRLGGLSGRPMVQHVYERARRARSVSRVVVATDDERIVRAVEGFGGEAFLTRAEHRSGTERMAEVAARAAAEIYVNVQGDEPLIEPVAIDAAVEAVLADTSVQVATLCVAIHDPAELADPNVVKVVCDFRGDALYFSRAPIPWVRDPFVGADRRVRPQKHIGLYVFRREALLKFPTLPPGNLEQLEQLEQLRLLENGYRIRVVETPHDSVSVDVPADLARVEKLLQGVASAEPHD